MRAVNGSISMPVTSRKFSPQLFICQPGIARRGKARYSPDMKFRLLVELDSQTKRWSAVFPELPGCATAGDTEKEAIANAKEALALWFEPAPVKLRKNARLIELAHALSRHFSVCNARTLRSL